MEFSQGDEAEPTQSMGSNPDRPMAGPYSFESKVQSYPTKESYRQD